MGADYSDALRDLYRSERTRLLAFARGVCGDLEAAEDAVQAAFERLLRRSAPPRELRPFVYRAVRNAAVDVRRRRRDGAPTEAAVSRVGAVAQDLDGDLDLLRGLGALPERERVAVVLCLVVGCTAAETGALLGTSPNTIATRRRRGLERLRRALEG